MFCHAAVESKARFAGLPGDVGRDMAVFRTQKGIFGADGFFGKHVEIGDLSALSLSHLRYFAASLIADKLSAQALADAVMAIPDLEAAALQLVDRSERRYGGVQKAFAAAGKSPLLREEISALSTWLSL